MKNQTCSDLMRNHMHGLTPQYYTYLFARKLISKAIVLPLLSYNIVM